MVIAMSFIKRTSDFIGAKVNKILNNLYDPRDALDYDYEMLSDDLSKVKQAIVIVTTSITQLDKQKELLNRTIPDLDEKVREALKLGREDLARDCLERKASALTDIITLTKQIADITVQKDNLVTTKDKLTMQIELFRTTKEVLKAQYNAAEASSQAVETVSGISHTGGDVRRAKDKTEAMAAKASALNQLVKEGVLEDVTTTLRDPVDDELTKIKNKKYVDEQLEMLKKQIPK
jgi:phage shock protein A